MRPFIILLTTLFLSAGAIAAERPAVSTESVSQAADLKGGSAAPANAAPAPAATASSTSTFAIASATSAESGGTVNLLPLFESLKVHHKAFETGELLKFNIKYQFMTAGHATMEVKEGSTVMGRPTFHFVTNAQSTAFIDKFFKVRDHNASLSDKETLISFGFHQNLREGKYRVMRNTTLNYKNGTYQYEKTYKGKTTKETGPLTEPVGDILSAFFHTRTLPLEPGQEYKITVFSDKTTYPLSVKVYPGLHKVTVPAGVFTCIKVRPVYTGDAIFKARDGEMHIWLTNDDRKLPVLIRSKVFIGAFDAELAEYNSPETAAATR